jgi:hypothetical protein
MVRKRKTPPKTFGAYENFSYLLTELELLIEAGTVRWPAGDNAAREVQTGRRFVNIARKLVLSLHNNSTGAIVSLC